MESLTCISYGLLVDVSASIVWSGFDMVITEGLERFLVEGSCLPSEAFVFPPRSGELVCRGAECREVLVPVLRKIYGRGGRSGSPLGEAIRSVVGRSLSHYLLVVTDGRWNSAEEDSVESVVEDILEIIRRRGIRVVLLLLGESIIDYSTAVLVRDIEFEPIIDVEDLVDRLQMFSITTR